MTDTYGSFMRKKLGRCSSENLLPIGVIRPVVKGEGEEIVNESQLGDYVVIIQTDHRSKVTAVRCTRKNIPPPLPRQNVLVFTKRKHT